MITDKRENKWKRQRTKRGFDDRETWDFFHTHAQWVLPRLKRFRKIHGGYPCNLSAKKWKLYLKKMITAFELICQDDMQVTNDRWDEVDEGLGLFRDYYFNLWW